MLKHPSAPSRRIGMLVLSFVAVAVAGGIAIGWKVTHSNGADIIVVQDYIVDVHDKRQIVGASDHLFIGQVIEQTGYVKDGGGLVYTQFSVQVERNIKGKLNGVVVVRQPGGYDEDYDAMQIVNGDLPLKVGTTYILATSTSTDMTFQTMFAGFGYASLDGPSDPATLITEYEQAFNNQIVDP